MITPDRLLERSVGQEIGVIIINPMSGEEATKPATVLSVMTGLVLDMDGKNYAGAPGRVVFDQLPDGRRSSPTLRMTASSTSGQTNGIE
jgi:hypothetical protein